MLGLGQKVSGDPVGIVVAIGDDENFRRAGDHVDADRAEDDALGGGDIGIARPDDLGDGRDALRAIGQRRDRLRAADAVDFLDAGNLCGGQHRRIDLAFQRRHDHDDARHAGNSGRHGVHQHGTRIARRAAGHIEADGIDGRPARAEADADLVLIDIVLRLLAGMMLFDTGGGKPQRLDHGGLDFREGRVDFRLRHAHRLDREIDAVETGRIFRQRRIATGAHIVDNGARGGVDVFGNLTLGCQESGKPLFEIGRCLFQPDRHSSSPSRLRLRSAAPPRRQDASGCRGFDPVSHAAPVSAS